MWFGTDAGVSRYDGYRFRNFSTENGIPDNTVFGSYEDHKGRIWFRSMSGKLSYFMDDSIYSIGANKKLNEALQSSLISSIYVDKGDTIWCGVVSGTTGYFKIAPPYKEADFHVLPMSLDHPYLIDMDAGGGIWGTVSDPKNIYVHGRSQPRFMHYNRNHLVDSLDAPGKIVPNSRVLKKVDRGYVIAGELDILFLTDSKPFHYFNGLHPISLYEDKNRQIWAGFYQGGVSLFKKTTGGSADSVHYLPGLSVSGVEQDREGGYWFTSLEKGVYYMASGGMLFYDKAGGLSSNKVLGLLPLDSAHILAGMSDGSLTSIGLSGLTNFSHPSPTTIYKLSKGPGGSILVGCVESYIIPADYSRPAIPILADGSKLSVKCFSCNSKGDLWAGNYYVLVQIDPRTGIVIKSVKAASRILSIYCDEAGTVWLGCSNGLWKYKDDQFLYAGNAEPLFKNRIEDIKVGKDGTWWFATKGAGIICKRGEVLSRLTQKTGLSSNTAKCICIDDNGTIWAGTNKGINRITALKGGGYKIENYSVEDGLISDEINELVRNGQYLWAATNQGIAYFHIRNSSTNTSPPPIYLTELTVNREKMDYKEDLKLKYYQNFIAIQFIGLAYKRSSELRYKYRLEGLDSAWSYTTSTSIQYTTLPYGSYVFQVYAINSDGMLSLLPASAHFRIAKPVWLEKWFILLVAVWILTGLFVLYKQRIKVLRERLFKTAEVNRRIAEIELKALRAQMNPHFIFNCIASIQHFILKNDADSANKYLSKFSKLIRQVLINSTQEYISMDIEIQTLELYIELERMRFQSKFNYQFMIDSELDTTDIFMPPLILQPYVENAIWHGLMHLEGKTGELLFKIEKSGTFLKCTIEDNGIGRNRSLEIKGKTNSKHRSVGLSITKERLENINSIYQSNLTVEFIDKIDSKGEGTGTIVELFIPLNINKLN
jgi:hypothetical protein